MFLGKTRKFRKTLSFRLTLWYAVIFTFSSFIVFSIFYFRIYSITMARVDEELIEETEEISEALSEHGIDEVRKEIAAEAEEEDESSFFIRVISLDRKTLVSTDMTAWGDIHIPLTGPTRTEDASNHVFHNVSVPGLAYKARVISARIGPREIMQMGMILEDEEAYLMVFRNLFCYLFLILAVFSGVVGWFLAKRGLEGVAEVTRTAMIISTGSPDKRVKARIRYEEVEKLADAFNKMLDRIQTIHESIKQTNDNIAHDLRSPLARIRGIAEMTLMKKESIKDYKNMAVSTVEECDALIDMINTMLEITEAEAGVIENKTEAFDLVNLVSEACEIFRPMADDKYITLKFLAPDSMMFRGDLKRMQRIVTNLLENAIKYTPDHGTVSLRIYVEDGKTNIAIEDTGTGISQEDLPHIFERFYRTKQSRSNGGNGLGLSLAKAFVETMGGTITARSTMGKGSLFTVSFSN